MPDAVTLNDGTQLVSLDYAARIAGVSPKTIRTWDQNGLIQRRATLRRTRYYRRTEIMKAEAQTRRADPTGKRARRLTSALLANP